MHDLFFGASARQDCRYDLRVADPDDPPKPPLKSTAQQIDKENAALILGGILLAIVVPAILTLRTVNRALPDPLPHDNPSPLGYTVSLLIYLLPTALLAIWFLRHKPPGHFKRRAFFITLGLLVPIGFALDIMLGNVIFRFPNTGAILEIYGPGFIYRPEFGVIWDIPIEEFIFYIFGFVSILLVYIWNGEYWVPAYSVDDYSEEAHHPPYVFQPQWGMVIFALIALAAAFAWKRYGPCTPVPIDPGVLTECHREGFPLYFTFLVILALVPALLLFRTAGPFINWRAFSITMLWVLLTSLLWEATLANPFYWWHYEHKWMMNLPVRAWANLPVEAVFLWIIVTFTTVIVFETIKIALHIDKPWPILLFGPKVGGLITLLAPRRQSS